MRIRYDSEVDALRIVFTEATVTTRELGDGIAADYNEAGQLVGLKILDARQRLGGDDPLGHVVLEGLGR